MSQDDAAAITTLIIEGGSGPVDVRAGSLLHLRPGPHQHIETRTDGDTLICTGQGAVFATVPREICVVIKDRNAPIRAQGLGLLTLQEVNGAILSEDGRGDLIIEGGTGHANVQEHQGTLFISEREGELRARGIKGPVTVRSPNIRLRLSDVQGTVTIAGAGGDTDISDVEGDVVLEQLHGSLRVRDARGVVRGDDVLGNADLQGIRGSATLGKVLGNLRAHELQGDVTVDEVSGNAHLEEIRGSIALRGGVKGNLDVREAHGGITLGGDVLGNAIIQESGEEAMLLGVWGNVDVRELKAPVTFAGTVKGNVTAHDIAELSLTHVEGSVRARSGSGGFSAGVVDGTVHIASWMGNVRCDSVAGEVTLRQVDGALQLINVNGDLRLIDCPQTATASCSGSLYYAGTPRSGQNIELTSDGNALLACDPDANLALELHASGRMQILLPLEDQSGDEHTLTGRLGDGSAHLKLTSHGSILVTRRDQEEAQQDDSGEARRPWEGGGPWGRRFPFDWDRSPFPESGWWGEILQGGPRRSYERWVEQMSRRAAREAERAARAAERQAREAEREASRWVNKATGEAKRYVTDAAHRTRVADEISRAGEEISRNVSAAIRQTLNSLRPEIEDLFGEVFSGRRPGSSGEPGRPPSPSSPPPAAPRRINIDVDTGGEWDREPGETQPHPAPEGVRVPPPPRAETPSSHETPGVARLRILQALREGTISVEEAERLLDRLT
ncbi:MAG: hypothetical protein M1118_04255 [Chloroflexi bacterium]|nr:hypothetical protein [Chloroflexota bacterium]